MSTKIITVAASPPAESSGADYNKGAALNATEFDQNLVNLRAAIDRRMLKDNDSATFAVGSVSAPSISFTGDTDSGLYRIGANNIGAAVNGAKVLDIGTTGLSVVGKIINTTGMESSSADNIFNQLSRGTNGHYGAIKLLTGATSDWVIGLRETSDSDLHIFSYGTTADVLTIARATGLISVLNGMSVAGDLQIATKTPASAGATGTAGTIAWDASYVYVCTATNTWKRVAIATW